MIADQTASAERACPNCGRGPLVPACVDEEFEFGSEEGPILVRARGVPVEGCPDCGERLTGPAAGRVHHAAICEALKLLTPDEIRSIREGLGMTQAEFAHLTGFGEATISRWERGRLLQNRANDRFLRLLAGVPVNVPYLRALVAS